MTRLKEWIKTALKDDGDAGEQALLDGAWNMAREVQDMIEGSAPDDLRREVETLAQKWSSCKYDSEPKTQESSIEDFLMAKKEVKGDFSAGATIVFLKATILEFSRRTEGRFSASVDRITKMLEEL